MARRYSGSTYLAALDVQCQVASISISPVKMAQLLPYSGKAMGCGFNWLIERKI